MTDPSLDQDRMRAEYARRSQRLAGQDKYSLFNPEHRFLIQGRQQAVLRLLDKQGMRPLHDKRILEVGCGGGGVLLEYLTYGGSPHLLHGVELQSDLVEQAYHKLPHLPLQIADGQHLPYASNQFDLVLQYTMFSSILDDTIQQHIAREMLRMLRGPQSLIVWYDFWINPTNPHTRGLRKSEIRQLFPDCTLTFHRISLAPPITRRLVKVSWTLAHLLEKLHLLNTHYLAAIRPRPE